MRSLQTFLCSRGSPAFLIAQRRKRLGEPVSAITRTHPGPVARAPGQGRPPGLNQARQHRGGLAFPDRDDPCDQPAVFGHVDRLATADSGQHLTHVVPQIPKTDGVRIGHHVTKVPQSPVPGGASDSGLAETVSWFR